MTNVVAFLISFAASVVAIVVVLYTERQRRPLLRFRIVPPIIIPAGDDVRPQCTWFGIEVSNAPCSRWLAWVYTREPAMSCRAYVSFFCTCGDRLLPGEMPARWSGLVEPRIETIQAGGGQIAYLRDAIPTVDLHANSAEGIHPVVVFPSPFQTFGWTNESYLYGWRHPQWAISHDTFVIRIRATTADREFVGCFRIDLTGGYANMRIDQLDSEFDSRYSNVA